MKGLKKGYMKVIQDDSGITENKMETTSGLRVEGLGFASVDARGVRLFLGFGGTHPVAPLRSWVSTQTKSLGFLPPKPPPSKGEFRFLSFPKSWTLSLKP